MSGTVQQNDGVNLKRTKLNSPVVSSYSLIGGVKISSLFCNFNKAFFQKELTAHFNSQQFTKTFFEMF